MITFLSRKAFLSFSRSKRAAWCALNMPFTRHLTRRFIAGEKLSEAITAAKKIAASGRTVTLDCLGEEVRSPYRADCAAEEYIRVIDVIRKENLPASISIKLSQLGAACDPAGMRERLHAVAVKARDAHVMLEIDMEGSRYTDLTLEAFRWLGDAFPALPVRVALQGYLKRTYLDAVMLAYRYRTSIRLVKGAYEEPSSIAYRDAKRIREECIRIMRVFLREGVCYQKGNLALGSHDPLLINWLLIFMGGRGRHLSKKTVEFQMLYGIREDEQLRLVREGYPVRVYVPYGTHWFPYFMRRMAERPANVWFVIRALIGG